MSRECGESGDHAGKRGGELMRLKNTSRYPDAEVRLLVNFALRNVDTRGLAVHVKNSQLACAGRAYESVPFRSSASTKADRLIVLRIGSPSRFPKSNISTVIKWVKLQPGESYMPSEVRGRMKTVNGQQVNWLERRIEVEQPYGGASSPKIEMRDWREALIRCAAHEGQHIRQYQHNWPRSEVECESVAAKRLEEYRMRRGELIP
jgi:hypothetical protein